MIDILEPKKSMKIIKDHHKSRIEIVKFCELTGKKVEEEKKEVVVATPNSTTSKFSKFTQDLFKKDPKKEQEKKAKQKKEKE